MTAQVRPFVAKASFKAFMPSVATGTNQPDWAAVRPKWRGGYITVTSTEAVNDDSETGWGSADNLCTVDYHSGACCPYVRHRPQTKPQS